MAGRKKSSKKSTASTKKPQKVRANRKYKDRLFSAIFGNPSHKAWTLALYNAVNNSNYTDPTAIKFNTVENTLFLGIFNDVSFIIAFELILWEHQSTFNPNEPLRFLRHYAQLLEKYIATAKKLNLYSTTLQSLPRPKFVCFYNGTQEQPDKIVLKLSDAFGISSEESDIEVKVTMLNINYGKNKELMEACKPLKEYSWFIDAIRRHQSEKNNLEAAIDLAIDEMPKDFVTRKYIIGHRAEVKKMFVSEWTEQEMLQRDRNEARMDERHRVAEDMLRKNMFTLPIIAEISKLSEDAIRGMAKSLGLEFAIR